jgi:hypothetical protein
VITAPLVVTSQLASQSVDHLVERGSKLISLSGRDHRIASIDMYDSFGCLRASFLVENHLDL